MQFRQEGQIRVLYEATTCTILIALVVMLFLLLATLPLTVAGEDSVNAVQSRPVEATNLHERHYHDHKHHRDRHHDDEDRSPSHETNNGNTIDPREEEVERHRQRATASPGGNSPPTASKNPGVQYYKQYYNPSGEKPPGRQDGYDYSQDYRSQNSTSPDAASPIQAGAEGSSSNIRASGEMARGFIPNQRRQDQAAYDASRDGQHNTARNERNADSDEYTKHNRRRKRKAKAVTTQLSEHNHSHAASRNQNDTEANNDEEDSVNLRNQDEEIIKWQNISQQYTKDYIPHRSDQGINTSSRHEDAQVNVTDPAYRSPDVKEELDLPPYTRVSDSARNDTAVPVSTVSLSSSSSRHHDELEQSMAKAEKRNEHMAEMIKQLEKENRDLRRQKNQPQGDSDPVVPTVLTDIGSVTPEAGVRKVGLTIAKIFMIAIACFVLFATYRVLRFRSEAHHYEVINEQHQPV